MEIERLIDLAKREAGTPEAARALEKVEAAKSSRARRNTAP